MTVKNGLIVLFGLLFIVSCKKDMTPLPNLDCADTISYSQQVQPFIDLNCTTSGCHDASASGGYNLTTHSGVSNNAAIILSAINHDSGTTPMPMGGSKLPDSTIQQFDCWISQGKLDN